MDLNDYSLRYRAVYHESIVVKRWLERDDSNGVLFYIFDCLS